MREGFDDVFLGQLAERIGVDRDWVAERIGGSGASVLALIGPAAVTHAPSAPGSSSGDVEVSGDLTVVVGVTGIGADYLYELDLLTRRAEAVLGAPEVVPEWFQSTLGALADTRPIDWVDPAAGREHPVEVLDAIAYGLPG